MLKDDIKEILFTEGQIVSRSRELGEEITRDYSENPPLLVALLRGSVPFLAELIKHIDLDVQYDFMDVSSYSGTESTGNIRILKDLETSVIGKHVLIVEDIVDTGNTLHQVAKMLKDRGAASVKVVSLLDKPSRRKIELVPDYVGYVVDDLFVVGYGLDFNQRYRCLPFIGVLKEECYQ